MNRHANYKLSCYVEFKILLLFCDDILTETMFKSWSSLLKIILLSNAGPYAGILMVIYKSLSTNY